MVIPCLLLLLSAVDGGVAPPARVQIETRAGPAGEVTGVVTDDRGVPVPGAKLSFRGGDHHRAVNTEARTGPDGQFSASKVARGMYGTFMEVEAPGFSPLRHTLTELNTALRLTIRIGKPMKVAGVILAPDAKGGSLRLIAAPPAGADLRDWRYRALPLVNGELAVDGTFSLDALEGDYELEWSRPAGIPFHALVHAPSSKLRLTPPNAALEGRVFSSTGSPLASANVAIMTSVSASSLALTTTDPQGRYVVRGLEDGDYVAEVTSDGVCHSQQVNVKRGAGTTTMRFGSGWELRGDLVDATGHGQPGVTVLVKPISSDGGRGNLCDIRAGKTDSEGRFFVTELVDGEVEVNALTRPLAITVKAMPGASPIHLVIPTPSPQRTVSGVVLGPDRKPIAGAMVGDGRDFTDDQGRFTLERKAGTETSLKFYRRCFVSKTVPEAETATVMMERRPCLSANVVDAAKKPIGGMHSLQVQRADGHMIARCTTRAVEGDCTLEAELGPVVVSGTLVDGRSVSLKLELTSTEKQEVQLIAQ